MFETDESYNDTTLYSKNKSETFDTKDSTNCDFSSDSTSQFTLVEFIRPESTSSKSVDPEKKVTVKPCQSTSNLIFHSLNPFSINGKRFSQSMDALNSKSRYTRYYYKKIVSLTGTKEI